MMLLEPIESEGARSVLYDGRMFVVRYSVEEYRGNKSEHWVIEIHKFSQPDAVIASVIRKPGSYGYDYGLYELAFMQNGKLMDTFEKDWGDEVLGYLSEDEVMRWINRMLYELGDL